MFGYPGHSDLKSQTLDMMPSDIRKADNLVATLKNVTPEYRKNLLYFRARERQREMDQAVLDDVLKQVDLSKYPEAEFVIYNDIITIYLKGKLVFKEEEIKIGR